MTVRERPESLLAHFEDCERRIVAGECSAIGWYDIGFRLKRGAKRDGFGLKLKSGYGKLVYTRPRRPGGAYVDEEITREEAIAEIMVPGMLRSAVREMENTMLCHMCGSAGVGDIDRLRWAKLLWFKPDGIKRDGPFVGTDAVTGKPVQALEPTYDPRFLDICEDCVGEIGEGTIGRKPR